MGIMSERRKLSENSEQLKLALERLDMSDENRNLLKKQIKKYKTINGVM